MLILTKLVVMIIPYAYIKHINQYLDNGYALLSTISEWLEGNPIWMANAKQSKPNVLIDITELSNEGDTRMAEFFKKKTFSIDTLDENIKKLRLDGYKCYSSSVTGDWFKLLDCKGNIIEGRAVCPEFEEFGTIRDNKIIEVSKKPKQLVKINPELGAIYTIFYNISYGKNKSKRVCYSDLMARYKFNPPIIDIDKSPWVARAKCNVGKNYQEVLYPMTDNVLKRILNNYTGNNEYRFCRSGIPLDSTEVAIVGNNISTPMARNNTNISVNIDNAVNTFETIDLFNIPMETLMNMEFQNRMEILNIISEVRKMRSQS